MEDVRRSGVQLESTRLRQLLAGVVQQTGPDGVAAVVVDANLVVRRGQRGQGGQQG